MFNSTGLFCYKFYYRWNRLQDCKTVIKIDTLMEENIGGGIFPPMSAWPRRSFKNIILHNSIKNGNELVKH